MFRQNRASKFSTLFAIFWLIVLILLIEIEWIAISQAQDKCKTALTDAEIMYEGGHFDQAINLLNQCLPEGIPETERIEAYRILVLSYIREDYQDSAKQVMEKIFDLDRYFEADANDPKDYRELVEKVRKYKPIPFLKKVFGGRKKSGWYFISGTVITAAFSLVIFYNTTVAASPDLPQPPELPRD